MKRRCKRCWIYIREPTQTQYREGNVLYQQEPVVGKIVGKNYCLSFSPFPILTLMALSLGWTKIIVFPHYTIHITCINFTAFHNYGFMSEITYLKSKGLSLIVLFPALSIVSKPMCLKGYTSEASKELLGKNTDTQRPLTNWIRILRRVRTRRMSWDDFKI